MKPLPVFIVGSILMVVVTAAFAIEQPRIIPRSQDVPMPIDEAFARMRKYFTDPSLSQFHLVSEDARTHTLVAKETGISDEDWSRWAYCEAGPMQMISKLRDGTVLVTVKLDKSTGSSTFASVAADFEGTYGIADKESKVACTSKFVLEDNILAAAGAAHAK
jgi:hypothetical protein